MRQDSLTTGSSSLHPRIKIGLIGLACVAAVAVVALAARSSLLRTAEASSPATSNITVPSTVGQTVSVTWTGTIPPGSSPNNNCVALADTPGVDQHLSTVTLPAGIYNTLGATFAFKITWTPVVNINSSDEILTVLGPGNVPVGSSDGGSPVESVGASNLGSGTYKVVACGFANAQPQPYTGTLTITTVPLPPTYSGGSMGFGPSTIVDFQRTEGEPLLHIDKDGKYWESGPWGFSTNMSFMHRSVDGGDQFNVVSPTGIRPNGPPGGGDTTHAIDDQGVVYFGDLEGALTELDCSVSNDQGNTWKKNPACVPFTGTDRQWLVLDNGSNHSIGAAGAADNTAFYAFHDVALGHLIFSSPGSTGQADLTGGLVFTAASTNPTTGLFYSGGGNCGEIVFDPVSRNLYYPCAAGDHIEVIIGHVNPGQRTGLTFTTKVLSDSPGGEVSNLFPPLSVDSAGNVYVVWSDPVDHNLYYQYSTDQGNTWSSTVQLNSGPARSNVFAWAEAGSAGNLVAVWLGNDSTTTSDNMPNWQTDPVAAAAFPFYGYVALVTNANTPSPNIDQNRFSTKPVHYGQICNSGIGCTAQVPAGDRIMADFLSVDIASDGAVQVMYNDTTSQYHGAHLLMARQLTGPTPLGTTLNKATPSSPTFDPAGDAQVPHYGPTGAGANQPQLDFKSVAVNQIDANTVRIRMTMDSLSSMLPPPGKTSAFWITRFQALSKNDGGTGEAYRIFYVGAESTGGAAPVFFAGSPTLVGAPVGCNGTTPGTCKVVQYPMEFTSLTGPLAGSVSGNTLCIDMPLSLFGANRPIGNTLYNVAAFSGGRSNSAEDVYAEGDSTRSFNFSLGTITTTACMAPTIAVRSNVALASNGSTATASSSHSSGVYPVSSTIDGESIGNNWGNNGGWNDGTRAAHPDWVEVTFPAAQAIDEINVITLQNNWKNALTRPDQNTSASGEGILDFDVQYWNPDGSGQWVTIPGGTVTGNDKALRQFLFTAITTTKIRVFVNNSRNNWTRIVEVEAFGVPGP